MVFKEGVPAELPRAESPKKVSTAQCRLIIISINIKRQCSKYNKD